MFGKGPERIIPGEPRPAGRTSGQPPGSGSSLPAKPPGRLHARALGAAALLGALLVLGSGCTRSGPGGAMEPQTETFFSQVRPASGDTARLMRNAHYYRLMGQPQLALKELEEASSPWLRIISRSSIPWPRMYEELGEFSRAQKLYQEALSRVGANPALKNNLCYSYYLAGRWDQAQACFQEALAQRPRQQDRPEQSWPAILPAGPDRGSAPPLAGSRGQCRGGGEGGAGPGRLGDETSRPPGPIPGRPAGWNRLRPPRQRLRRRRPPRPRRRRRRLPPGGRSLNHPPRRWQNRRRLRFSPAAEPAGVTSPAAAPPTSPVPGNRKASCGRDPAPTPAPARPRPLTAKELTETAIEVRNGTPTPGLAHQARSTLSLEGFNVTQIGNHIDWGAEVTVIYYRPEAQRVAQVPGPALSSPSPNWCRARNSRTGPTSRSSWGTISCNAMN